MYYSVHRFDLIAEEVVSLLLTFGAMLDIPSTILGVTVLAWGTGVENALSRAARARVWWGSSLL